jgi:HEAT repeat protein/energy-coupling factor transporter ATP-binding protein EcfA2
MTPSRKPRSIAATPEGIQKLKDARKEKGLTNQTISDETYKKYGNAGISEASVNNFITKKKPVQPESVIKIIEVLGLKPEDIVALEEWQIVTGEVKRHKNSKNKPINWHEICQKQATERQKITTNSLTFKDGIKHNREQLYVPLGLVERKKRERRTDESSAEKGSQMYAPETYEVTQTYAQKRFFEEVIQQGKSNSQGKRLAVIGEPGAGKTTLLQELEQWVLNQTDLIPVWVSLASLGEKTLEDYLLNNWLKEVRELIQVTPEDMEALKQLFEDKKVWLLLDGADEMSGRSQNLLGDIASQINGWLASARVILTCRLNVWDGEKNALDTFDTYRTLEFSYPEQVHLFIEKWFDSPQSLKGEKGESLAVELKRQLEEPNQSRIRDLIKNPLRLALLCRTWQRRRGNLPETQAELYGRFVEDFYIWKGDKFPTSSQQRKRLNQGLGQLALRAIEGEKSRFRLTHGFVCQVLGEPDTELHQLALELGWLNRVGVAAENPDEPVYAFYHPTFEEYFAALAVEDWDYFLTKDHVNFPVEGKKYRIFESQWKQVILLWLGREDVGDDQKEAFIQKLVEFEDGCGEWNYDVILDRGFYEYRAYFLAAAGIAEFKDCSKADDIVNKIIELCFEYLRMRASIFLMLVIREANVALFETAQQIVIDRLIQLLVQTSDAHQDIAKVLGEIAIGKQTVINKLIKLIEKKSHTNLAMSLLKILGKIALGNQGAIDFLVKFIKSSQDEATCKEAIAILGEIGVHNQTAINFLSERITVTKDECTLLQVAESLGKIDYNKQKAIDIIVELLKNTPSKSTREKAVNSLEKIGLNNQTAIIALVELLNTIRNEEPYGVNKSIPFFLTVTNQSTCRQVVRILGTIAAENQTAIDALINLFTTTKDQVIRDQTANSLEEIARGNKKAIKELNDYITHSQDEQIRKQAENLLWKIDPKSPTEIRDLSISSTLRYMALEQQSILAKAELNTSEIEIEIDNLLGSILQIENPNNLKKAIDSLQRILLISEKIRPLAKILQIDLTSRLHFLPKVVIALRDCLSNKTFENDFNKFDKCYKIIWHCAANLPYPQFYQIWHHPVEMTHPEVEDNTPVGNATVQSLETQVTDLCIQLQNRPIFCLDAEILETETDPGEIAQTLCELIWKQALPNQQYPEVSNAAQLRRHLNELQLKLNQPQALLLTNCEHPTPKLTAFCHKLTNTIAIAFLTEEPLEAPLKGFPPNQPNLLSAIETWLEEV